MSYAILSEADIRRLQTRARLGTVLILLGFLAVGAGGFLYGRYTGLRDSEARIQKLLADVQHTADALDPLLEKQLRVTAAMDKFGSYLIEWEMIRKEISNDNKGMPEPRPAWAKPVPLAPIRP